jgi:transcriptional regulator with XRE-family HTH domain
MSPRYAEIAKNLRRLRHERGLTIDKAAKATNGAIPPVVLGSYERGSRMMSVSKALILADIYGVTIGQLLNPQERCQKCDMLSLMSDVMV